MLASLISPMEMILNSTSTITGGPVKRIIENLPVMLQPTLTQLVTSAFATVSHLQTGGESNPSLHSSFIFQSTRDARKRWARDEQTFCLLHLAPLLLSEGNDFLKLNNPKLGIQFRILVCLFDSLITTDNYTGHITIISHTIRAHI